MIKKTHAPSIDPESALMMILEKTHPLGGEESSLTDALGRIVAADIVSDTNIPPASNSAMDGYALHARDTAGATRQAPASISIAGEIRAGGESLDGRVLPSQCVRIMTGAPIPEGADAVIQVEDTSESGGKVLVYRKVVSGENIRNAGEDIATGQTVINKGDRLDPAAIGLLASLNRSIVPVYCRPSVAIISTGDEILDVGEPGPPGRIRNSNAYTLMSEVKKYGAIPYYIGIARDTIEDTRAKFTEAFKHDIVISTGGVSMGKYDHVAEVMRGLEIEIFIETIKMKPGKPCIFGARGTQLFFGLPGNPVSTMVSFIQFVRPAILKLMGATRLRKPLVHATIEEEISKKPDRTHYIRGFFDIRDGELHVTSTGPQGSGILRSMHEANCLIILPEGVSRVSAGDRVIIQMTGHEEIA